MTSRDYHLHDGKTGAALGIRVTPCASENQISAIQDDGTLKVRLKASGSEEKLNRALIEFLAQVLEIAPGRIDIIAGFNGSDKLVSIIGMDADLVQRRILKHVT